MFYWVLPYPNTRGTLWVNFRSPLLWDFFAISTYFTISAVFWYLGLVPDLATARDRTKSKLRQISLSSDEPWLEWIESHLVQVRNGLHGSRSSGNAAGDFGSQHCQFRLCHFPDSRLALDDLSALLRCGRGFSGFAMVMTLMILVRKLMHLEDYITHSTSKTCAR